MIEAMAEDSQKKETPNGAPVKALRTFESDVADVLKHERTSVATMVVEGQEKLKQKPVEPIVPEEAVPSRWDGRMLMTLSGIIVIAGIAVFLVYLYLRPAPENGNTATVAGQSIIPIDTIKTLSLTGLSHHKILDALIQERDQSTLRLNSTEGLVFTEADAAGNTTTLDTQGFLSKIAPDVSSAFLRSLNESFAFGILGFDGNQPFLIVRTDSYQSAYAGMLKSEVDFYRNAGEAFFTDAAHPPKLPTTTDAYFGTDPGAQLFQDAVVKNHDARVVKNELGDIVLLYSFVDPSTLVITTNAKTYGEILEKLKRGQ